MRLRRMKNGDKENSLENNSCGAKNLMNNSDIHIGDAKKAVAVPAAAVESHAQSQVHVDHNHNHNHNHNKNPNTNANTNTNTNMKGHRMFRRKKTQKNKRKQKKKNSSQDEGNHAGVHRDPRNPPAPAPFSSYSEMTIFHNSTIPDTSKNSNGNSSSNNNNNNNNNSPPHSPSYVASRTKSVMRFALQSRMYEEPTMHMHTSQSMPLALQPQMQQRGDMDIIMDDSHSRSTGSGTMGTMGTAGTDTPMNSFSGSRDGGMNTNMNMNMNLYPYGYGKHWENLCDDPTVEESIECVFGHQLEDGLEIEMNGVMDDDDYNEEDLDDCCYDEDSADYFMHHHHHHNVHRKGASYSVCGIPSFPMKRYSSGKLVQVGSFSPFLDLYGKDKDREEDESVDDSYHNESPSNPTPTTTTIASDNTVRAHRTSYKDATCTAPRANLQLINENDTVTNDDHGKTCKGCRDGSKLSTGMFTSPKQWPQCPLLLKPTPGSGTRIRGVRYANSTDYIMDSSCQTKWWAANDDDNDDDDAKADTCGGGAEDKARSSTTSTSTSTSTSKPANTYFCNKCCPCPINNGNEEPGKTLVIDFESDLFQGTMQIRIRHSRGATSDPYDDSFGYFSGLNRQYQSVVQGRFKKEGIPMNQCVVGQTFSRPIKPPAPYVAKGAFKVMRFFAPRLMASIDGDRPHMLSPLGSTPQSLMVDTYEDLGIPRSSGGGSSCGMNGGDFKANASISHNLSEPVEDSRRLVPCKYASSLQSSASRAKARKKVFDKLCAENDDSITFRTDRIYTFEFLQHLMNFETLEVGLGNILGKLKLAPILNGQPMNLQAACQLTYGKDPTFEPLWSFDLWHEDILHDQK